MKIKNIYVSKEASAVKIEKTAKSFWDMSHSKEENGSKISELVKGGKFDREAILYCIYGATKDLAPRTFGKIDDGDDRKRMKSNLDNDWEDASKDEAVSKSPPGNRCKIFFKISAILYCGFYSKLDDLLEYYNSHYGESKEEYCKEFDRVHHELCRLAQEKLARYYPSSEYGKGQKIVNMTFKHMYCLLKKQEDVSLHRYEGFFEFCHMPLDSYILEWFKREHCRKTEGIVTGVCLRGKGYTNSYNQYLKCSKMTAWSSMGYVDDREYCDNDGKYTYVFYRDRIRQICKQKYENTTQTPLQTEIETWKMIQNELAAEAFLFALCEDRWQGREKAEIERDKNIIRLMSYDEKKKEVRKLLDE